MIRDLARALTRVLRLPVCPVDGQHKDLGRCFCRTCYFALPIKLRNPLFIRKSEVAAEFFDSYVIAILWLADAGMYVKREHLSLEARKMLKETGLSEAWRVSKLNNVIPPSKWTLPVAHGNGRVA